MKYSPPVHALPSFCEYLRKVFHFRAALDRLSDARHDPDVSPQAVFLTLFYGFIFRVPSFQQLEADLAQPDFQRWVGVAEAFREDVLRYSLCGFALPTLEGLLVDVNRRLKRNKALDPGRVQGRRVAALDGIEVLSSFSRCCESCLQRRVGVRDGEGQAVEAIQYYHRAVGCQIVSSPLKPFLALEWLRPGEGEDTAALRLLAKLPQLYGSPFFDILLLDSLYAQAPVLKLAQQIGWDLVITLKQENRDLFQDAQGLFRPRPASESFIEQEQGRTYQVRLWEESELPFTQDHPQPVRVVRSEEDLTQAHCRKGQIELETTHHRWFWITTLAPQIFSARQVRRLGHQRWKLENNGWNDLTQNWALKHGFLHACKHRPKARTADGRLEPVPNRGLAAVTLILCLAFVLCSAFALLHSKIFRRYVLSLREVSRQLYRSVWQGLPPIRAPD